MSDRNERPGAPTTGAPRPDGGSAEALVGAAPDAALFAMDTWRERLTLEGTGSLHGLPMPMVGRRAELQAAYEAIRDASVQERLQTVAVTGEAGIGKTRLLAEALAIVDPPSRDVAVYAASCREPGEAACAGIVAELLRQCFAIDVVSPAEDVLAQIRGAVAPFVQPGREGQAAELLGFLAGLGTVPAGAAPTPDERLYFELQAIKTFYNLLRFEATRRPHVLIFGHTDDLTDRSATILAGLLDALAETRTAVFVLAEGKPPQRLKAGEAQHREIRLEPLDRRQTERLARAILEPVPDVPQALVDALVSRSGGNAGLLEENVGLLVQHGVLDPQEEDEGTWRLRPERLESALSLPGDLQAAARARIDALEGELREVLGVASVFGNRFHFGGLLSLLRATTRLGAPPADPWIDDPLEATLNRLLLMGRRDGLIVFRSESTLPDQVEFAFRRGADQALLYLGLPPDLRGRLHRLAAQWLVGLGLSAHESWTPVIGHHLAQGRRPERAARFYLEAADALAEREDHARARELLRRALALAGSDRIDLLGGILLAMGDACVHTGDLVGAVRYFRDYLQATLVALDEEGGVTGWLRLGRTYAALGDYELARHCLGKALDLSRRTNRVEGVAEANELLGWGAWLEGADGAYDLALGHFRRAAEVRRHLADQLAVGETMAQVGELELRRGRFDAAESAFREARAGLAAGGRRAADAVALLGLASVREARGDQPGAIAGWSEGLVRAEAAGDSELRARFLHRLGVAQTRLGNLDEAREQLEESLRHTPAAVNHRRRAGVITSLAELDVASGDLEGAAARIAELKRICELVGPGPTLARALRVEGRLLGRADAGEEESAAREAARCFDQAALIFERLGHVLGLLQTLKDAARLKMELGDVEGARTLLDRAAELEASTG